MNEQKIAEFFAAHDREIADNGFSQRVMRSIPKRKHRLGTPVIFAVVATTVVMAISAYIITISSADFGFAGIPYLSIGIVAVVLLFSSFLVADVSSKEI
jgi:hypothetical protein